MYTQKKIHGGFVGSLFLIAAVLLFFFHTRPAARQNSELQNQLDQLAAAVQTLEEKSPAGLSGGAVSEVELKELDNAIPETLEQDGIIIDLNTIAKTANVSFNALTFNLQKQTDLPAVNISAGFQGSSADIIRFLKMLEVNPRKFLVKEAGVSHSESAGGIDLANLNLTLQAFYRQGS